MDRACRINATFLDILAVDERMLRQEKRILYLEERGMHTAAAYARENLAFMVEQFLLLRNKYTMMIQTADMIEEARRAKAALHAM